MGASAGKIGGWRFEFRSDFEIRVEKPGARYQNHVLTGNIFFLHNSSSWLIVATLVRRKLIRLLKRNLQCYTNCTKSKAIANNFDKDIDWNILMNLTNQSENFWKLYNSFVTHQIKKEAKKSFTHRRLQLSLIWNIWEKSQPNSMKKKKPGYQPLVFGN